MKKMILATIILLCGVGVFAHSAQLPPATSSPICPEGQHMNEDCADAARESYHNALNLLNAQFANAATAAMNTADAGDAACNDTYASCGGGTGQHPECLTALIECLQGVRAEYFNTMSQVTANYTAQKIILRNQLHQALLDCCE